MTPRSLRTAWGEPSQIVRPSASTWMRSQSRMIRRRSWSTINTPRPRSSRTHLDRLQQIVRLALVHSGGGLVQKEEPRATCKRACDLDAALLAVRQRRRHALAIRSEPDLLQQRGHGSQRLAAGHGTDLHVLAHRHVAEQPDLLERAAHAEPGEHVRQLPGGRSPGHLDAAGSRPEHAARDVQQGRLATAVGTDQADDLALRDRQVDVVERADAAELLDDALGNDRRWSFGGRCAHGARSYR